MDSGAIGRHELTFHERMMPPIMSELKKMNAYGYNRRVEPKRLKKAIISALRNVSYSKRYSVL